MSIGIEPSPEILSLLTELGFSIYPDACDEMGKIKNSFLGPNNANSVLRREIRKLGYKAESRYSTHTNYAKPGSGVEIQIGLYHGRRIRDIGKVYISFTKSSEVLRAEYKKSLGK